MTLEKQMQSQLHSIFDLPVSFQKPSDAQEQEGVFIEIERSVNRIKDAREIARVTGKISIFAYTKKLPIGYLSKHIARANPSDTQGFFFHEFEENKGTFLDIAERGASFVYLFNGQYDPDIGTITSINLELSETL